MTPVDPALYREPKQPVRGFSLAVEIGVLFVVLGLVPLMLIGRQYATSSEEQIRAEVSRNLAVIADGRAGRVEAFARDRLRDVTVLANTPLVLDAMAPERIAALDPFPAEALVRSREAVGAHGLYLVDPSGDILFADDDTVGSGTPVGQSQQPAPARGLGSLSLWALTSVADRASTLLEPQMSDFVAEAGFVTAFVGAPLLADGTVRGVVVIRVGLEEILSVLADLTGLGATGEVLIADQAAAGAGVRLYGGLRFPDQAPPDLRIGALDPAAAPFMAALSGQRGVGSGVDYRGEAVISAWRYLPSFDWALVVKVDRADRLAQFDRLRAMGLVVLITVAILVIVLAWLMARAITTPIQELEQAAERLAEGRHDGQRQDSLRQDSLRTDTGAREIKALARSFNDMATRVRIYQTGLERMVEDRTAELRIAKEEAEAAARAKSEFLAMMSHEVRTPLNGVVGVAELLSRRSLDPDSRQLVSTIRQSGSALTELLNDILDISRIEAGKLSFEMRDFDPRALVQGLVALMEHAARKKGLSFDLAVDRDLPQMLRGDPARLRQVLLNLVGNAVKFTETGGVKVEVSLLAEVEGTVELCFSVRDTGIGVPKDLRDRLFQPFSQLEAERSARFGGAGLGLAISRRLVEGMGGEIYHVSLDPEPGSCFVVELPFSIGDPEALCVTALDADGASPGSHCPPLRLLLIEDEPVNQQVLLSFLEADGHQVTLAEEGRSGLELALTHSYDLILTDLRLPGLSGIEVAERIQAAQGGATPPIIAITANILPEDREACTAVGMAAIVPKPIRSAELLGTLAQVWAAAGGEVGFDLAREEPVTLVPDSDAPIFEPAYLEDLIDALPPEEVGRLVEKGARAIQDSLAALLDAPSADATHKLAGAAGSYGLMALRFEAKALEAVLRGDDVEASGRDTMETFAPRLQQACDQGLTALEAAWKAASYK